MRAALYCKFPIEKIQSDILEQERILIRLMEQIKGELYAIYVDHGNEHYIPQAAFLQMIQDGTAHRFDILLCLTPDLFCAQQKTSLSHLILIFPDHHTHIG